MAVDNVSLSVRRREVVGVAGVAGNGQRELQEAIAGLRTLATGSVAVAGTDCSSGGPKDRMAAGLAYVPEDRLGVGLAPGLELEHNIALKNFDRPPHSRRGLLSWGAIEATAKRLVAAFDVGKPARYAGVTHVGRESPEGDSARRWIRLTTSSWLLRRPVAWTWLPPRQFAPHRQRARV